MDARIRRDFGDEARCQAQECTVTNSLQAERIRVAVVGSGFAGLGAAIALKRAGFADIVILERADDVGGVWRDNTYPGAACDVQSPVYSFSFAPSTKWNYLFARQDEIHDYLRRVVTDFGLTPHLRLNCPVEEARWDTSASLWRLTTPEGQIQAEHLVVATGALADPTIPEIPGIDRFAGSVFHSARWDHTVDLRGKRVAVIGTGASAIQFVPAIQPLVEQLTLFQRTPPWVMPRHDRPISPRERALLRALPPLRLAQRTSIYLQRELTVPGFRHPVVMKLAERTARKHLQSQVSDPKLRAKLTPNYRLGCKRILLSNDYLASLDQPNADVITSGIREVTADGVIDNDGTLHRVDAIILGTGFKTERLPLTDHIYGPSGDTMAQMWGPSPSAYLGTSVAGFPNVYLMHGPNIGLGHNSAIAMFEAQAKYIVNAVRYSASHGVTEVEPTAAAQDEFTEMVDRLTGGSVWTSGGCSSWYLDSTGRNSNLWPATSIRYRFKTLHFKPADHLARSTRKQPVS
jgi:cation diffusion facilitator CzcD-associated flavoprotein CzcO